MNAKSIGNLISTLGALCMLAGVIAIGVAVIPAVSAPPRPPFDWLRLGIGVGVIVQGVMFLGFAAVIEILDTIRANTTSRVSPPRD